MDIAKVTNSDAYFAHPYNCGKRSLNEKKWLDQECFPKRLALNWS